MRVFLRCSLVWPIHDRSLARSPSLMAHSCSADDERIRVTNRSVRIVPRLGFSARGTGRKISGGIERGPDTFVLLEIPTVSGSRDSIQNGSFAEKLDFLQATLMSREGYSLKEKAILRGKLRIFKNRIKTRWQAAKRRSDLFLTQNRNWLTQTIDLPIAATKQGRPKIPFIE